MSWDIVVGAFPGEARTLSDLRGEPPPVARRSLIEGIQGILPGADFTDPAWGRFEGRNYSIEFSMGKDEQVPAFTLHVRGDEAAVGAVAAIVDHLRMRAIDCQTGQFFDPHGSLENFASWRAYRDGVVVD